RCSNIARRDSCEMYPTMFSPSGNASQDAAAAVRTRAVQAETRALLFVSDAETEPPARAAATTPCTSSPRFATRGRCDGHADICGRAPDAETDPFPPRVAEPANCDTRLSRRPRSA